MEKKTEGFIWFSFINNCFSIDNYKKKIFEIEEELSSCHDEIEYYKKLVFFILVF
jgi:hypothetical protein